MNKEQTRERERQVKGRDVMMIGGRDYWRGIFPLFGWVVTPWFWVVRVQIQGDYSAVQGSVGLPPSYGGLLIMG